MTAELRLTDSASAFVDRKILDMLPDRPPQVTFTCDVPSSTCGFQFWIGKVESFYCGLSNCTSHLDVGYDSNFTEYTCQEMSCSCIPGKMLCGEDGSVGQWRAPSLRSSSRLTSAHAQTSPSSSRRRSRDLPSSALAQERTANSRSRP